MLRDYREKETMRIIALVGLFVLMAPSLHAAHRSWPCFPEVQLKPAFSPFKESTKKGGSPALRKRLEKIERRNLAGEKINDELAKQVKQKLAFAGGRHMVVDQEPPRLPVKMHLLVQENSKLRKPLADRRARRDEEKQ